MFSLFLYFTSAFSRIKVKLAFLLNKRKDFFTFKLCAYTKRISQEKLHLRAVHLKERKIWKKEEKGFSMTYFLFSGSTISAFLRYCVNILATGSTTRQNIAFLQILHILRYLQSIRITTSIMHSRIYKIILEGNRKPHIAVAYKYN